MICYVLVMNIESRHLYVDDAGMKLGPSAVKSGGSLCEFCGVIDKCVLAKGVQRCGQFMPIFAFAPPIKGIDGVFSTFRSSSIWYERARHIFNTHQRCALVDSATKEVIAYARITGAYRGACDALLERHAWSNHLCLAAGIRPEDAPAWLRKEIRNRLGQRYIKSPTQIGTVIYLRHDAYLSGS